MQYSSVQETGVHASLRRMIRHLRKREIFRKEHVVKELEGCLEKTQVNKYTTLRIEHDDENNLVG